MFLRSAEREGFLRKNGPYMVTESQSASLESFRKVLNVSQQVGSDRNFRGTLVDLFEGGVVQIFMALVT